MKGGDNLDVINIYNGDTIHLHFPILDPEGNPHIVENELFDICIVNPRTREELLETALPYDEESQMLHITLENALTSTLEGTYVYYIRVRSGDYSYIVTKGKLKVASAPRFDD